METFLDELEQVDYQDLKQVKAFYESHELYFKNVEVFQEPGFVKTIVNFLLLYAHFLVQEFHYDKALLVLNDIEKLMVRMEQDENYQEAYNMHRFVRAMVLGHQKKFKESYPIFNELLQEDPEHHYYRVWYYHTKLGLYNWVFDGLMLLSAIVLFIDLMFSFSGNPLPQYVGLTGIAVLGGSYVINYLLRKYLKQQQQAHTKNTPRK